MKILATIVSKLWILGDLFYTHRYILIAAEGEHLYFITYTWAIFHANLF